MSHTGLIKRPPEIDVRRAVHFKILPDTHAALRIMCIERGISLQEFFEEIAQKALTNDPRIERILDEFVRAKKERYFKQLAPADAKSLFDIIEIESPLK